MLEMLNRLLPQALTELEDANTSDQLEAFRMKWLGVKGTFRRCIPWVGRAAIPDRAMMAQRLKEITDQITDCYETKLKSKGE